MADVSQIVSAVLPIIQQVIAGSLKAGGSGFFGKIREGGALVQFFGESATKFKGNDIVQQVIKSLSEGGGAETKIDLKSLDLNNVLAQVGGLDSVLKDTGDQGKQVKQFVYDLADKVTSASGGGMFGGGEKVSDKEKQFLADLKQKLGV